MGDCLIVLGMHRSGTSAMAGVLRLLGVELGSNLMGPKKGENDRGFFEDVDLHDLHDGQLAVFQRSWHDLSRISNEQLRGQLAGAFQERLARLLSDKFGDAPLWAVKDPRLCGLLPLWLPVLERLGHAPRCVVMHRHPAEVAASLAVRNGFSVNKSGRLWLAHNLDAERFTRSLPRVVVGFNQLLYRTPQTLARIAAELDLEWPIGVAEAAPEVRRFLSRSLRHHRADSDRISGFGERTPLLERLNRALIRESRSGEREPEVLDRIGEEFDELFSADDGLLLEHMGDLVGGVARRLEEVESQLDERTEWLHTQSRELQELHGHIERQGEALQGVQRLAEHGSESRELQELEGHVERQGEVLRGLQRLAERGPESLEQLEQEIGRQRDALSGVEERVAAAETGLSDTLGLAPALAESQAGLEAALESVARLRATLSDQSATLESFLEAQARLERYAQGIGEARESLAQGRDLLRSANELQAGLQRQVQASLDELTEGLAAAQRSQGLQDERLAELRRTVERGEAKLSALTGWQGESIVALRQDLERQGRRLSGDARQLSRLSESLEVERSEVTDWRKQVREEQQLTEARLAAQEASLEETRGLLEMVATSKPWRLYLWVSGLRQRVYHRLFVAPAQRRREVEALVNRLGQVTDLCAASRPDVSVVLASSRGSEAAVAAVEHLSKSLGEASFELEILLADLGAEPLPRRLGRALPGLRLVRARGDGAASRNRAARAARGTYLLFADEMTRLTADGARALIESFEVLTDAGLVGAKMMDQEGTVLEAGLEISPEGDLGQRGFGAAAEEPEFSHAAPVDGVSLAALAVPRKVFLQAGGLDPRYRSERYQAADLALRISSKLAKTIYCQATVGVVPPDDGEGAAAAESAVDRERLASSWAETLAARRQATARRRYLILDHRLPTPDQDSGSLRMWNLIEVLQGLGFQVTFLPHNLHSMQPYHGDLERRGVEVIVGPFASSLQSYLEEHGELFDFVQVCRAHIASECWQLVREHCPRAPRIFDTVDLVYLRETRQAELEADDDLLAGAERRKASELATVRDAHATFVVSGFEKEVLEREIPGAEVRVVSNVHRLQDRGPGFEGRKDIFFIGGFEHPPNVDAVHWLVDDILPRIREELPAVHLYVVGSKPPAEVVALASDTVTVTGFVPDVVPFFQGCRLSVAPLRFGAGVKGKVNQSMAYGLPCVMTPTAAEGLELDGDLETVVAETAAELAAAVVGVYRDPALWERLSLAGIENIREHFSFEAARRALTGALESLHGREGSEGEGTAYRSEPVLSASDAGGPGGKV